MKRNTKQKPFQFPEHKNKFIEQVEGNEISFLRMNGNDDFIHLSINPHDTLIYRKTAQIDEDQITVWDVLNEDYCDTGFAFDNFGEISIYDGDNYFTRYKKTEVKLLGVVIGIIKPFDAQNLQAFKAESNEITAHCAECKKEITGTIEFIKSEGWELEKDKQICLTCDLFGGGGK